ncbi:MAG: Crp/Fnr family transcriptional regulator [Clostridiales bacterium]|nr:Crp/Fnr family transcriptional regulator [Clostridiales bacterium]
MDKANLIKQLKELSDGFDLKISEAAISKAIGFSRFKVYSKGEIIARTGDKTTTAGLVISGVIRSYYVDKDGNDITQYFAAEAGWCIDSGMIEFNEMQSNWEALEDTTVMLFEVKDMKELIYGDENLKKAWISILESGIRYKVYRENGFLVENATERYLAFRKTYPMLSKRVPLRYIATYLGITPESLSRIRSSLKENEV